MFTIKFIKIGIKENDRIRTSLKKNLQSILALPKEFSVSIQLKTSIRLKRKMKFTICMSSLGYTENYCCTY